MGDEQTLLTVIKKNPIEDLPRLVLADWLDEHGEPERGEFIRLQVAAAPLPYLDDRRAMLERREWELEDEHKQRWLGPWAGCGMFNRGLLHVCCRGSELPGCVAAGGGETAFTWVERLRVTGRPEEILSALGFSWLRQVFWLDLTEARLDGRGADLGEAVGKALATSPYLSQLTRLELGDAWIGELGMCALASSDQFTQLTSLNLSYNVIGDVGSCALARSPHFPQLTTLILSANRIGDTGANALAASPHFRRLTYLDLMGNPIGKQAALLLIERYGECVHVQRD